jgi:hypothetical protein
VIRERDGVKARLRRRIGHFRNGAVRVGGRQRMTMGIRDNLHLLLLYF